jgi:two-component system sensor histidine kinase/response regulator
MLTSADQMGDAARCRLLGVDAYLVKPVRQSALRDAIATIVHGVSKPRSVKQPRAWEVARTPRRILLAEDNVVNQRVATGILQKAGHTVEVANNGLEALRALETGEFDIILMDMQMPEMSGPQAMAAIRESESVSGRHMPIIALTAHAMKGDREKCLAAGADEYIPKPLAPKELLELVDTLVRQHQAAAGADPRLAMRGKLLDAVGGDEALLRDVTRLFGKDAPVRIAALQSAIQAGEIAAVQSAAHSFRGSAANFGESALLRALGEIETAALAGNIAACAALLPRVEAATANLLTLLGGVGEVLSCAS